MHILNAEDEDRMLADVSRTSVKAFRECAVARARGFLIDQTAVWSAGEVRVCSAYQLLNLPPTTVEMWGDFFLRLRDWEPRFENEFSVRENLAELRRLSGLTWEKVALLLEVDRRSLHNWARGDVRTVRAENRQKLVQVLTAVRKIDRGLADLTREALFDCDVTGLSAFTYLRSGDYDAAISATTGLSPISRGMKPKVDAEWSARFGPVGMAYFDEPAATAEYPSATREGNGRSRVGRRRIKIRRK